MTNFGVLYVMWLVVFLTNGCVMEKQTVIVLRMNMAAVSNGIEILNYFVDTCMQRVRLHG